jgi:DNA-binding transcriptional ArsR family regulator
VPVSRGGWVDPNDPVLSRVTALARELADPIRLTALQLLAAEGPHTMSQLAEALAISAPRLGNHLARLRAGGLVEVEHAGRHAVYRVAGAGLGQVLAALSRYAAAGHAAAGHADAGHAEVRPARAPSAADIAHSCYDHAAGRLGVTVFATLVGRGALRPPDGRGDELALGPDLAPFADLGVDLDMVDTRRRKLATACLDKTYRLPHLGGVLGQSVLAAFVDQGLVERASDSRVLVVTAKGVRRLPELLPGFRLGRRPPT